MASLGGQRLAAQEKCLARRESRYRRALVPGALKPSGRAPPPVAPAARAALGGRRAAPTTNRACARRGSRGRSCR